jgi:hypothetical protein
MNRRLTLLGVLVIGACSIALIVGGWWWWKQTTADQRQIVLTIPPGSARREALGQEMVMLPKTITVTLGLHDTLVIRNEDVFVARVGPWRMEPGQQFRQHFREPAIYDLVCTTIFHNDIVRVVVIDRRSWWEQTLDTLVE